MTDAARARREALLVLVAAALVFLPGLGWSGLSSTEGHRAIPAWEMLSARHEGGGGQSVGESWLVPTMFGQAYLRKPPGMPWAIAGMSAVFGQTEFAARAVSALSTALLALAVMAFARRWFGAERRHGLVAGLGVVLTPLLWGPGRSAEIEALNNLWSATAALLVIDAVMRPGGWWRVWAAGGAVLLAGLAKGPAGLPVIASAGVAACVGARSWSAVPRLWPVALVPTAGLGLLAWLTAGALGERTPVTQEMSEFFWTGRALTAGNVLGVITMPLLALLSALPSSAAVLTPWIAEARDRRLCGVVCGACVLSLVSLAVMGVANPRYGMPSLVLLPVLIGPMLFGVAGRVVDGWLPWWRVSSHVGMAVAAAVAIPMQERDRERRSGRSAGEALSAALPDGAVVQADYLVEARPDVLWYAQRRAARDERRLEMRWTPGLGRHGELATGEYACVRTDTTEAAELKERIEVETVATGTIRQYRYEVVRRGR
ncbi:MAG: ArnT family glycosyltransferase [Phycisphaerales bacterium]